jgi:hypothetical protein
MANIFIPVLLILAIIAFFPTQPTRVVYDCRLAEIAVDYPQQVKERCRHLNDKTNTSKQR